MRNHRHEILIVEDDPGVRFLMATAFDRHGTRVMVAEDGKAAVDLLASRDFCAIVLDLVIPKIDGYGVIHHILEEKASIPIVVVTSLKPDELSGVDRRVVKQVLFKPLDLDKLIVDVQDLCHSSPAPSPARASRKKPK